MKNLIALSMLAIAMLFVSCAKEQLTPNHQPTADALQLDPAEGFLDEAGLLNLLQLDDEVSVRADGKSFVYTLSNETSGNQVMVFSRNDDGTLTEVGKFSTGGTGTGTTLGNQGAIAMSSGGKFLYVVNPGSNDITHFAAKNDGSLTMLSKTASGGEKPISITNRNGLVYVLNAGGTGNITGFAINQQGQMTQLSNSTKALSTSASDPAQISFSPDGKVLVVTEKATNTISTYPVLYNGRPGGIQTFTTAGDTPSGFVFGHNGNFFVSEAGGGTTGASTMSTYHVSVSGKVSLVNGPLATNQTTAGWVGMAKNNQNLFVINTGSNNISSLKASYYGTLSISNGGNQTTTMLNPIDAAMDKESKYLYVLTKSNGIVSYNVGVNGQLTQTSVFSTNLPSSMTGMVAK